LITNSLRKQRPPQYQKEEVLKILATPAHNGDKKIKLNHTTLNSVKNSYVPSVLFQKNHTTGLLAINQIYITNQTKRFTKNNSSPARANESRQTKLV
jgi:hypothetical protein